MTTLDLITDALVTIGEVSQGQTISPEDAAYCFTRTNAVLDSLSQEIGYIFNRSITPYALIPNQPSYAIGPTAPAPFNTARPTKIDAAQILLNVGGNNSLSVKDLDIIDYAQYVEFSDKKASAQVAEKLYFDAAMPNGNLFLYPVPTCIVATQLELTVWAQLQQLPSLTTVLQFPPGYYEMLVLVIGVAISPAYDKPVDPTTAGRADTCTKRIKSINELILAPGRTPVAQGGAPAQGQQQPPALQ